MIRVKSKFSLFEKSKLNPLINNMSYVNPENGHKFVSRNNASSNFYNVTNLLDEAFYKKISTIMKKK